MAAVLVLDAKITGVDSVQRMFAREKEEVWGRLRTAMEQGGRTLKGAMSHGAAQFKQPTGRLMRSIYFLVKETKGGEELLLRAGASRRGYYARFLEKGTSASGVNVKPHVRRIGALKGKVANEQGKLRSKKIAERIAYVKAYQRAFILKGRPFIIPAYEANRAQVEQLIENAVKGGKGDGHA